jgi:hypothetical protein
VDRIADTIGRLTQRFGRAEARKPNDNALIEAFADTFGVLPIELAEFLRLSDGLDLKLHDHVVGHIYGLTEMRQVLRVSKSLAAANLIPMRGDGCGNYDCVDIGTGPTKGAVLFWDHEAGDQPAYLLGGDFAAYLEMWSDFVVSRFFPDGSEDPAFRPKKLAAWPWIAPGERTHPWPIDEQWLRARDSRANLLLSDPQLRPRLIPGKGS